MDSKIFIIGCGPSLVGFDFSKLAGRKTIAVNLAINFFNPTIFLTADSGIIRQAVSKGFWGKKSVHRVVVMGPDHIRYSLVKDLLSRFDEQFIPTSYDGNINLDSSSLKFATGRNSGFCALQYAILCGYKEIYLLGFDLLSINSKRHFYDTSLSLSSQQLRHDLDNFFGHFKQAFTILKNSDVKVFSCSSISRLNEFIPFVPFEKVS